MLMWRAPGACRPRARSLRLAPASGIHPMTPDDDSARSARDLAAKYEGLIKAAVDGVVLIDERGRTVAYQQIVHGFPETQFRRPSANEPTENCSSMGSSFAGRWKIALGSLGRTARARSTGKRPSLRAHMLWLLATRPSSKRRCLG